MKTMFHHMAPEQVYIFVHICLVSIRLSVLSLLMIISSEYLQHQLVHILKAALNLLQSK